MKYGYFKENKYIITNPKTPVKWINYIGTLDFGGFVDNTGGMLLCKGDPALNRISKYIPQLPASNFNGTSLYIRIKKNKKYKIFSPYYVPTLNKLKKFRCKVGMGYSKFISKAYGLKIESKIFIPIGSSVAINDLKITNISSKIKNVDAIPVIEYTHHDALKQFNNADWVPQTMQSKKIKDGKFTILKQCSFYMQNRAENYISSNHPISSFESDRNLFLGDNSYGTWQEPLALKNKDLSNYEALRGDNIGALLHKLGKIKPGETKRIIIQIGQTENVKGSLTEISKYRNENFVDEQFNNLNKFWSGYLSKMTVKTPSDSMNYMLNTFNPYQCFTTYNWSRFLSLYQLGLGARGIGFRDSSQDVLGIMDREPKLAQNLIRKLLMIQRRNGCAMHSFYPSTMVATYGEVSEYEDRLDYYGDDHLWIIYSVCEYIKESGDIDFLNEVIPFYEKDKNDKPIESGTVFEHLNRAIEFSKKNIGKHKMPLLGFADWNDCVNLPTGAESLFIANQYGLALLELIELYNFIGKKNESEKFAEYYEEIRNNFNKCAWDGKWFVRYFDENGDALGSQKNDVSKIYLNGQSWPIISGFATEEKAKIAMQSVFENLNTEHGIKLSHPGYNGYQEKIGGVTTYPPGVKENGGIFLHPNPWAMIAETKLGNGDRAFQYYNQINPITKNKKAKSIDKYEIEPYVYAQNIISHEHPQFGLGRNSWLSGTSAWTYVAGTKYIIGLRPTYDGLIIDPCIPKNWKKFTIFRKFRGKNFNFEIQNPNASSKGIKEIIVNDKSQKDNKIKFDTNIENYKIIVKMA